MDAYYNYAENCQNSYKNESDLSNNSYQSPPPYADATNYRFQTARQKVQSRINTVGEIYVFSVVTTFTVVVILIPFILFILGVVYRNDCPVEPYLPVYLMVTGLGDIMSIVLKAANFEREDKVLQIIIFVWFLIGNYWLLRTIGSWSNNPSDGNFCNPFLFYIVFCYIACKYCGCLCMFVGALFALPSRVRNN